jgi:hypothetical protein
LRPASGAIGSGGIDATAANGRGIAVTTTATNDDLSVSSDSVVLATGDGGATLGSVVLAAGASAAGARGEVTTASAGKVP